MENLILLIEYFLLKEILAFFFGVFVFLVWIMGTFVVGSLAGEKGRSGLLWFLGALLMSPIFMAVCLAAAGEPPKKEPGSQ